MENWACFRFGRGEEWKQWDRVVTCGSNWCMSWIKSLKTLCPRPCTQLKLAFLRALQCHFLWSWQMQFLTCLKNCKDVFLIYCLSLTVILASITLPLSSSAVSSNLSLVCCQSVLIKTSASPRDEPVLLPFMLWLLWLFLNKQLCVFLWCSYLVQQAPGDHS